MNITTKQKDAAINILYVFLILYTALLGSIFMVLPLLPLLYFQRRYWRLAVDYLLSWWLMFPVAMFEIFHKLKIFIPPKCPKIDSNEPAVIIMNHRTRLDWLYLWPLLYRQNPSLLSTEKIILKSDLKRVPGAGWAMECGAFSFLCRNWTKDKNVLEETTEYYAHTGRSYQVLIFPEGTNLSKTPKRKSDEFAEKNNLPKYNQVLHPRTTGCVNLVQRMRENGYLSAIYDISIGYPDTIVQRESEFVAGIHPKSVSFNIQRHPVSKLPATDDGLIEWCNKIWAEKETLLTKFYASGNNVQQPIDGHSNVDTTARTKCEFENSKELCLTQVQSLGLYLNFLYWVIFSVVLTVYIYSYIIVKLYAIVAITLFVAIGYIYGGMEFLEISLYKSNKRNFSNNN